jgi:predicted RNA-binding Zn-ribbon protein involved in translation (DUF1610 family)
MQTTADVKRGMKTFPCKQCGARLEYLPGTAVLKCGYCAADNAINAPKRVVEELSYRDAVMSLSKEAPTCERATVRCDGCHSELDPPADVTAFKCPFCSSSIVTTSLMQGRRILPGAILPFDISRDAAIAQFREWVRSRWFAPSALKSQGFIDACFTGTYLPAWTYDSKTVTTYTGDRGDAYYESQSVVVNGQRQTQQVRKIRWSPASGTVGNTFDDVLVMATLSVDSEKLQKLMPWDLQRVVPYDDGFLAGFRSETYHIDLPAGFEIAKELMHPVIVSTIRRDIGGDEQRIDSMNTHYNAVTFKHVLLPVWLSAYRFNNKVYQFVVNARTGEVAGERPYSWVKIALFVLMCIIVIGVIAAVLSRA